MRGRLAKLVLSLSLLAASFAPFSNAAPAPVWTPCYAFSHSGCYYVWNPDTMCCRSANAGCQQYICY